MSDTPHYVVVSGDEQFIRAATYDHNEIETTAPHRRLSKSGSIVAIVRCPSAYLADYQAARYGSGLCGARTCDTREAAFLEFEFQGDLNPSR